MTKCAHCSKEVTTRYNKFCNSQCAGQFKNAKRKREWYSGAATNIQRSTMKLYITEDRGYKCECCGISDYMGKPLSLQLDHIDGNPSNHTPTNVRLICPNCHSQQDNWGAKNKGFGRKSRGMSLS